MKIYLDTYGADKGEEEIIKGGIDALKAEDDLKIVFVGHEDLIRAEISASGLPEDRCEIIAASDFITNHDNPMEMFRGRADSSMALSLRALKDDPDALGMISAGNTGALMVGAISRIGLKHGLSAPVLCSMIPSPSGDYTCLLDCGAHMSPSANDLVLFARLGSEFYSERFGKASPRVGLLSVGAEPSKGNELVIEAHKLLKESGLNFIGNVEGCDAQNGRCDVIVADGFSGNVLIKSIEASGMTAIGILKSKGADPEMIKEAQSKFNFTEYGGAIFLGIGRKVVKMHGAASRRTVLSCVRQLQR